jgi:gluconolactonase
MRKVCFACLILLSLNLFGQDTASGLIAPGAQPKLLRSDFTFTEGPAVDKNGNIFFTDLPNDKIWKYSTDGQFSVFLDKAGRADGMTFDKKGNLIVAAEEKNELRSVSPTGKVNIFLTNYQGKELNGPNDLWIRPDGGIYFTDPYYQRPFWTRKKPQLRTQNVFYLSKNLKKLFPVDTTLLRPNGIIGTDDGKYLYVADILGNKTYKYKVNKNGNLSDKQLFADIGSDGMTMDRRGNLYLTGSGKGVSIYSPEGKKLEYIDIPRTTNVCFSGKNRDVLFVTAVTSVYTIQMQVRGSRNK